MTLNPSQVLHGGEKSVVWGIPMRTASIVWKRLLCKSSDPGMKDLRIVKIEGPQKSASYDGWSVFKGITPCRSGRFISRGERGMWGGFASA